MIRKPHPELTIDSDAEFPTDYLIQRYIAERVKTWRKAFDIPGEFEASYFWVIVPMSVLVQLPRDETPPTVSGSTVSASGVSVPWKAEPTWANAPGLVWYEVTDGEWI